MTREEARQVIINLWKRPKSEHNNADFYVDMFVNFGVLQLDEPLSPMIRLREQINKTTIENSIAIVCACIDAAGLKLVDK